LVAVGCSEIEGVEMKKKQIKHFIPKRFDINPSLKCGYPACHCYHGYTGELCALSDEGNLTRKGVTCRNCRRTRVFRKLK
jgi:hypothetical protein